MKYIVGFIQFWYDFVVGDDWTVAAVVVVALAITALIAHTSKGGGWWLMPLAVMLVLSASLWRVAQSKK